MLEQLEGTFTRYEIARILGARSLQLAMDAPILLKLSKDDLEALQFDTQRVAEKELLEGVLPITVQRPMPKKSKKTIKKLSEEELKEQLAKKEAEERKVAEEEKEKVALEEREEKEILEEGEIMEMATPEDEVDEEESEREEI